MGDSDNNEFEFILYRYTPSTAAASIFVACFAILTLLHTIRLIQTRAWFFISFAIGLIFELVGYIARIFSHHNKTALGPYIVQTLLILIAPPLFAASIYMTLGRIVTRLEAENASIIRTKWMTKIFVTGDVISFLLQSSGSGHMAAGTVDAMKMGKLIAIGGLAVQLVFFALFVFVACVFHHRLKKSPKNGVHIDTSRMAQSKFPHVGKWEWVMYALYSACVLILIRSLFRVVEFVQGNDGFIMKHEVFLYIFDALLMALTGLILLVIFPGAFLSPRRGDNVDGEIQLTSMESARDER
ncbi:hypothetical protein N7449_005057 [Penicillium cf. viridicatum]|uniref:RTA1 like protein n=1 Tax=Penicillium cf. viridicatum TaxID=2972119 RepID=A0A9W9MKJ4_9EURO|nr:hypothetical protein N7449_005057 [Penicillium cf. viridicatum]